MKKTSAVIAGLTLLACTSYASANVAVVKPNTTSTCEDASWVIYNLSESEDTNVELQLNGGGVAAYLYTAELKRTIDPGGYLTNAINVKTVFTNKGPGDISVNCQRQRLDRHDWRIDAGSGKTYQSNYHLDHVRPDMYIQPEMGQPEGTERGLYDTVAGQKPAYQR